MGDNVQLTLKDFNPKVIDRSVVDDPDRLSGFVHPTILTIAQMADEITPWSVTPQARDMQLRDFWKKESMLASTVYAAVARTSAFKWEVTASNPDKDKPERTIRVVTDMLTQSNRGKGWIDFFSKVLLDVFTQDNGAFIELIRAQDRPDSPVINLNHLDSAKCARTGDPRYPVIYTDRLGKQHYLRWWDVLTMEDMPAGEEEAYGVQFCAVSRALLAAQILRNIAIYKLEKVGGAFTRAVHLVSGVTQDELDDGLAWAREQMLNLNNWRYSQPVIIPGLDPTSGVDVKTIELASLPDAFDEDSTFKWYIAQLAMAFGMDYQELAPLPGGNLGSSQQSEILHQKTQGKGPALIIGKTEFLINHNGIIPRTVKFQFKEHDLKAENDKANASFTRSKDRNMQLTSGVLDPEGALELAVLDGDVPEHVARGVLDRGLAQQWYINRLNSGRNPEISSQQIEGGIESQEMQ